MQPKPIKGLSGAKGVKSAISNTMEAAVKEGSLTNLYFYKQAAAAQKGFGAALDILGKARAVGGKSKAQLGNKWSKIYSPALQKAWGQLGTGRQVATIGVPAVVGTKLVSD